MSLYNLKKKSFQLLTFPGREIIQLAVHMTCFQNESIYIHKMHLLPDACIVNIDRAKLQMRFLHYAFFLAKSRVSVPFS